MTQHTPRLTIIAAVAKNGVIGNGNTMPWHIPSEFKHFRETTMGGVLIMGRRTYDSIGRPLPGRRTIVITRNHAWSAYGVDRAEGLAQAIASCDVGDRVFIAGGAQVYAQAMHVVEELLISRIPLQPAGDTTFPEIDPRLWAIRETIEHEEFTVERYLPVGSGRPA